jgi:hypothetical protein
MLGRKREVGLNIYVLWNYFSYGKKIIEFVNCVKIDITNIINDE